jgi:hypothetical protein
MGKTPKEIQSLARNGRKSIAILDGSVYDLTDYITGKNLFDEVGSTIMLTSLVLVFRSGSRNQNSDWHVSSVS